MDNKTGAHNFLEGMENELNKRLPAAAAMRMLISKLSEDGNSPSKIRENIFLYYVLPVIHEYMQTLPNIGPDEARKSILCEYHGKVPNIASGNPFRRAGHPFQKSVGLNAENIIQRWMKPVSVLPPNQAFPDFGFRSPFPYKIVFDAKYFTQSSEAAARKALVDGTYEVMFYRGLPMEPPSSPEDPGWDYEFGCLLAYDASDNGSLASAWDAVQCKQTFWDGGNIFVMILHGSPEC